MPLAHGTYIELWIMMSLRQRMKKTNFLTKKIKQTSSSRVNIYLVFQDGHVKKICNLLIYVVFPNILRHI
jgi:hypothetical protein